MSGGLDSSAAACILMDAGVDCIGVHMTNWDSADEDEDQRMDARERDRETETDRDTADRDKESSCSLQDLHDAQQVCDRLGMPELRRADFSRQYWLSVFSPFLDLYRSGTHTPNPDVYCNRHVKFGHLKKFARDRLGAEYLATGHYARLQYTESGDVKLLRGKDESKDQSYFLSLTEV